MSDLTVGWVGMGKLGAPCALALNAVGGHQVHSYDPNPDVAGYLRREYPYPHMEAGIHDLIRENTVQSHESMASLMAARPDVVFVAVQTPHAPAYGGETPTPAVKADFEYGYLVSAVRQLVAAANGHPFTLVVVSTVLPGTMRRTVAPLLPTSVTLVYNPFFIAMGTTVADFLDPEFVLVGVSDPDDAGPLRDLYGKLHSRPLHVVSIESAELTKVAYNVAISMKVVFGNTIMEICEKTGADADEVIDGIGFATDRVISTRYMRGGMGDGGGCHPRDLIAMSWLAERLDLSYDLLGQVAEARDAQTGYIAGLVEKWADLTGLPVLVLGEAYKPGTDLTLGSPSLLLQHLLKQRGISPRVEDPYVHETPVQIDGRAVIVVATAHPEFRRMEFPAGSVVIDPFACVETTDNITYIPVGRKR